VDTWFGGLRAAVLSTAAKAYRLLRQIMNSAAEDRLGTDNPCRIKNGGREPESDRPSVSVSEVAITMSGRLPTMPSSTAPFRSFTPLGSVHDGQSTVRTCASATCGRPGSPSPPWPGRPSPRSCTAPVTQPQRPPGATIVPPSTETGPSPPP
jgi:hypothetical protein